MANDLQARDAPSTDTIPFAVPPVHEDDVEAVARVLRSGWWTTGNECVAFEQELARVLGAEHVVAVASCTAALELSLAELSLPPGARVGVPTWTFVATALAVHRAGATPVLIDVEPRTLNTSAASVRAALRDGLDAMIPVHFGGVAVDRHVHDACHAAGVPIIEDAAHAMGATDWRGPVNGSGSVSACYSFYATKNLATGEGGAIATDDPARADFYRSYRLHGIGADAWSRYRTDGRAGYDLAGPGLKANLPDLLAALGRSQLSRFADAQARRRSSIERYRANVEGIGLEMIPRIADPGSADHLCVIRLPDSVDVGGLGNRLRTEGIATSVHFTPLHRFAWMRENSELGPSGVPHAERLADHVLSLPLFPDLTAAQVDRVCERLAAHL